MKYKIILLVLSLVSIFWGCGLTGKVALDPVSQDFYETARLIFTSIERDIFLHLPDQESREDFIKDFWSKRDPDPTTEENEFKEEFFQRIDYANRRFREGIPGWKTDRGRIYIYLGPPERIDQRPYINDPSIKGIIWWGYYRFQLGIQFVDRTGDGSYKFSQQQSLSGGLLDAIERAKFGQIFAGKEFEKMFSDFHISYASDSGEIFASIPTKSLEFKAENGKLKADFEFEFFIYERKGPKKDSFIINKYFETSEKEIMELEEITFTFPYELDPGEYYFDVVVSIKPDISKIRKLFKIKN